MLCCLQRVSDGQCDSTAAGAQIQNIERWRKARVLSNRFQHIQRPLHQSFGVWTRHQHPGVNLQKQSKKLLVANDIGQWLARRPALAEHPKLPRKVFSQLVGVVRQ